MNRLARRLKADPCPVCSFPVRMPVFNESTECLEIRCLCCGSLLVVPTEIIPAFEDDPEGIM